MKEAKGRSFGGRVRLPTYNVEAKGPVCRRKFLRGPGTVRDRDHHLA